MQPIAFARRTLYDHFMMFLRLTTHWVYGGFLAGLLLLLLSPLLISGWSAPLMAVFFHLPVYMFHQFEEHDEDRFRLFFNETLGKGHDVLSPMAVFITNVPGVWGVIALSLYGATYWSLHWALIAVYLVLTNALVHIIHAFVFRRYNPGLVTAIVLFVPLGLISLYLIKQVSSLPWLSHAASLTFAIAIHAAILIHVQLRLRTIQGQA
jgi:hypothetical protein